MVISEGYNPKFDLDLSFGQTYEKKLHGLLTEKGKIEVKADRMSHKTGNLVIEFESRGKPSGIETTESDYWFYWIVGLDIGIMVPILKLKELVKNARVVSGGDNGTSRMYLVPVENILK